MVGSYRGAQGDGTTAGASLCGRSWHPFLLPEAALTPCRATGYGHNLLWRPCRARGAVDCGMDVARAMVLARRWDQLEADLKRLRDLAVHRAGGTLDVTAVEAGLVAERDAIRPELREFLEEARGQLAGEDQ